MDTNNFTLMIVDDEPINLILLEENTKMMGLEPITFMNPLEALEYAKTHTVDVIVSDFNMPRMDGVELIQKIKEIHPDILSIMITASDANEVRLKALESGVSDFLNKPIFPAEFRLRLRNMVRLAHSIKIEKNFKSELQVKVEEATSALRNSQFESLNVLSKAAEYKDPETSSHIARVAHYSRMLARLYGLDEKDQEIIFYAAPLHDIGKIGIEDAILLKPGKLTDEEFDKMKKHALIGKEILDKVDNDYLRSGAVIAATHHEKYNGKGYPYGLKGEEIPIFGRIVAIADVFDALTSVRPYKKPWSFEDAMDLIVKEKGEHFDPVLADLFIQNTAHVREIFEQFKEDEV